MPVTKLPPEDSSGKSFEDEIKLLRSEIKLTNISLRADIKTSLGEIKLAREESEARHDELIEALLGTNRDTITMEGHGEKLSQVVTSYEDDDTVTVVGIGAPSEVVRKHDFDGRVAETSSLLKDADEDLDLGETILDGTPSEEAEKTKDDSSGMDTANDDERSDVVEISSSWLKDEASVAAVGTSSHKGNKLHQTKKKSKKKKVKKSKKDMASSSNSNDKMVANSSASHYWGSNGGVYLKVVKRVLMGLISIACLLSLAFGHGNIEQHSDSSPRRKHTLQQHGNRKGLVSKASSDENGEGSAAAARILQTTELPTDSPVTPWPTVDLIYEGCDDTLGWVDEDGFGCRVYENNDEPGCPMYGHLGGDMGLAKDNCCHCLLVPTASPSTSSQPTTSPHPTNSPSTSSDPTSSSLPSDPPSSSSNPTSSSKPSNSPTTTLEQKCPVADKTTCGCDAVFKSDYRGTINVAADGVACIRWDENDVAEYPNAGLKDDNFCRNPGVYPDGIWCKTGEDINDWDYCNIPSCDACSCVPPCGQPLNETCVCHHAMHSQECCEENDSSCKCNYLKDACRISLQNDSTEFCEEAEAECCKSMGGSSYSDCECLTYEDICTDFPVQSTCENSAKKCCKDDLEDNECRCGFYEYASTALSYNSDKKEEACRIALGYASYQSTFAEEREQLEWLYNNFGGEYWTIKSNWLNNTVPHCDWFGIACNDGGYVTEINLNSNNLTGRVGQSLWDSLFWISELAKLDLSNNSLSGRLDELDEEFPITYYPSNLEHLDISGNNLSGHAPMWFSAALSNVNLSHNNITSISFRQSIRYTSLKAVDVSNNKIDQDVSQVLRHIPPNLELLDLSNNSIHGAFPEPFPSHSALQEFSVANNKINGTVPDFSRPTPQIRMLDLSNQRSANTGGLTGAIPPALSKLDDLIELYLAGNKLSGSIPTQLGNFLQLKVLNLSSNALVSSIPVELGRLDGSLDVLDITHNNLNGLIPSVLGEFPDTFVVHLSGNRNLSIPAPLPLCSMDDFDLKDDSTLCPTERNALRAFYQSAKGNEWTNNRGWLDEYTSYCKWHGVTCYCEKEEVSCSEANSDLNVYNLTLKSNSLSGNLDTNIGNLSSLAVLDLRDNDIKGYVPTEIGSLSKLTHLQLSYNTFRGALPPSFSDLTSLQIIHLHANRFSGVIPLLDSSFFDDKSSFIADCGYPSLYETTLNCTDCTMCCNSQDECTPKDNALKSVNRSYMELAGIFLACIFGSSVALALAVVAFDKKFVTRVNEWVANRQNNNPTRSAHGRHIGGQTMLISSLTRALRRGSSMDRYAKDAEARIGNDSVYCFLLGNSWCGWAIAVATIAVQLWLLFTFVEASEITDWTKDGYDIVYSWKCSWDNDECDDKSDLDWEGVLAFGIITGAHVLKDIINGIRMIVLSMLSTKSNTFTNSEMRTRIRYFIGGWLLVTVTSFTVFASAVYNKATATSNTEIIINSVVIIFMLEIDEYMHRSLEAISGDWVKSMSTNRKGDGQSGAPSGPIVEVKEDTEEGQNFAPDQDIVVQCSTLSEQLGGQSASPIRNSAGAQERTVEQDSDSNNAGGKEDVEANITGGTGLAQGNEEISLLKRVMDQMQDQINDIKEKRVDTFASFEEKNKLLRERNAALQRQLRAPQDSNDANDDDVSFV